jgi:Ca2+-binding RTX toxin-like protein
MANQSYYVATTGSDSGDGSIGSPFRTITRAIRELDPGDEVVVKSGTYNESINIDRGGAADNYVTIRSEVPGGALLRPPSGAWNGISVNANYVIVDGFDIKGARGDGIEANNVHHIKVLNNTISGSGESGIQFNWAEFITVEGNTTFNNASNGWFSGISIYQNRNITGDTTTTGFRTIVRDNVSYGNVTKTGEHTDGNGIIIDDFQSTQKAGFPNYTYPTLVENNLVYENGGKGIQVTWSDYVTVRNNTAWHNNQDPLNTGTWRGELSNSQSSNNTWVNNIAVADPSVNRNNTAIDNTSYGTYKNANVVWDNNITFNGTAGQASVRTDGGNPMPTAANGNKLGVDPGFVDAANGNFNLRAGSPAIDAGTSKHGLPAEDLDGGPRAVGTVDMGAYEYGSGTGGDTPPANTPPVARPDSGFSTTTGTALVIDDALLLANDTDADGNPLTITSVGSASNGTVTLTTNGDVLFTPTAGFTGVAGFGYTISDGRGGTSSTTVSVSVNSVVANSPPSITTPATLTVNENTSAVTTVAATDANGDRLTYALAGGADASLFRIDANTGALSFLTSPDFERPTDSDRNNVYLVNVSVSDGVNAPVSKSLSITVKDVAEGGTTAPTSFFGATERPAMTKTDDPENYELGMRFRATVDGEISALKYFRGTGDAGDTDVRTMTLWSPTGSKLGTVTITATAGMDGWQVGTLSSPIKITAGQTYTVSYSTARNYAFTEGYFSSQKTSADGMIVALANGGVFNATPGALPGTAWNSSNYWADVVFASSASVVAPPPTGAIVGTSGNDTLTGTAGNDTIQGLDGNDVLRGGAGNNVLDGGNGIDTVEYAGTTAVTVSLSVTGPQSTGVSNDTLISIENIVAGSGNDSLTGNGRANSITGADGNDTIFGRSGDDMLFGGNGNDWLFGGNGNDSHYGGSGDDWMADGSGNDLFDGGSGNDTVSFEGTTSVSVNLGITSGQNTGLGWDTLISIENVISGSGNDRLTGNAVANVLTAGAGNDTLNGREGNDVLTGGLGADTFVLNTAPGPGNVDRITDFTPGTDRISLSKAVFPVLPTGTLTSSAFAANTSGTATDSLDRIIYETDTGNLYYDADGTGSGQAVLLAVLSPYLSMSNTSFDIF